MVLAWCAEQPLGDLLDRLGELSSCAFPWPGCNNSVAVWMVMLSRKFDIPGGSDVVGSASSDFTRLRSCFRVVITT